MIIVEQCPPLPKPTLVKLASKQFLHVLGLNVWGVGSVLQNVTSHMEKGEKFIRNDFIHLFCICTTIENGMGCKKLGSIH